MTNGVKRIINHVRQANPKDEASETTLYHHHERVKTRCGHICFGLSLRTSSGKDAPFPSNTTIHLLNGILRQS